MIEDLGGYLAALSLLCFLLALGGGVFKLIGRRWK